MTKRELIAQLREQRDKLAAQTDVLISTAETEERALSDDEQNQVDSLFDKIRAKNERIEQLSKDVELEERAEKRVRELGVIPNDPDEHRAGDTPDIKVGEEPRTYSRDPQGPSFIRDVVFRQVHGDAKAADRLQRHAAEVRVDAEKRVREGQMEFRDVTRVAGQGGEFVPPLWLIDQYVKFLRAGRVTADLATHLPMPPGTDSINLPVVASGTAVAAQTADGANIQDTSLTTTSINVPVRTIAGQQEIALQLLEQSPISFDEVVFMDLAADYAAKLDIQTINGSGASGQMTGILNTSNVTTVAYTSGTPTVGGIYPKLANAVQGIASTRFLPATHMVMHPRRWGWFVAALDANNRPLVVPNVNGPYMAIGVEDNTGAQGGPVGSILGLPVYLDANLPTNLGAGTNQDPILVGRFSDAYLWEGAVRTRVLPEVVSQNLEVRLQLYAYVAFSAARYPVAFEIVNGTGTSAPTF